MSGQQEMAERSFITRGIGNPVISAILYIILLTLVGLVGFARIRTKCSLSVDALFVLTAMLPTSFYFVATLISNDDFRWNRHMADIPSASLDHGFKMVFAAEIMFVMACMLVKLSLMKLVRRVMSCASAFWRGLVVFVIVMVSAQGVTSCFLVLFQCGSPANFWIVNRQACVNHSTTLLASGIVNVLSDLAVTFLTVPCILSFQLACRQKVVLICIYGIGLASIGAGVMRTYFLFEAAGQEDVTWAYYPVWMTSAFQLYLGMICAVLPTTKHFFSTYFPNLFGPLSSIDHDLTSQRHQSMFGNVSSGEEELLDYEKAAIDIGSGVTIATNHSTRALSEEDKEYIKITQQTVVQVSRVGEV